MVEFRLRLVFKVILTKNDSLVFIICIPPLGSSSGPAMTYSVNQANAVSYNTTLIFDTNTNAISG